MPHQARAVLSTGRGEVEAAVVDISVAGLQLELRSALDCGEFVRVRLPLSPGEETSWIDPDALVVRTVPDPTTGRNKVGLSFLALPPAVLERLSERVAEVLAQERGSHEASPPDPSARVAGPGAIKPVPTKPQARTKFAPRAAQGSTPKTGLPTGKQTPPQATRPAPPPSANGPTTTARKQAPRLGVVQMLAKLFGRRSKTESPPKRGPAPELPAAPMPDAQPSRAELRDLFRSAIVSVQGEEDKTRKR